MDPWHARRFDGEAGRIWLYMPMWYVGMYIPVYTSNHLPSNIVSDGVLIEQGFEVRKS